jgi:hypothetical protein
MFKNKNIYGINLILGFERDIALFIWSIKIQPIYNTIFNSKVKGNILLGVIITNYSRAFFMLSENRRFH